MKRSVKKTKIEEKRKKSGGTEKRKTAWRNCLPKNAANRTQHLRIEKYRLTEVLHQRKEGMIAEVLHQRKEDMIAEVLHQRKEGMIAGVPQSEEEEIIALEALPKKTLRPKEDMTVAVLHQRKEGMIAGVPHLTREDEMATGAPPQEEGDMIAGAPVIHQEEGGKEMPAGVLLVEEETFRVPHQRGSDMIVHQRKEGMIAKVHHPKEADVIARVLHQRG